MNSSRHLSLSGRAAILLGTLFALFYGLACWLQYRAFGYGDFDLAIHVQSLWQLLRGSLDCSILGIPWPGNHANWILVLLAPIFRLAPSPLTLLFLQTLALALAAWPIYLLARREFGDERYGFFFVVAYCFYAPVGHVALFEFHPVAFATPLLLAAFYCARIGSDRWLVIWSILAATCQEDVPLVVAALCAYRFIIGRKTCSARTKTVCWTLGGAMLVWFFLCVTIIGPHFNRGNVGWINLYSQFGKSGGEIARNFLFRPDTVLKTLLGYYDHDLLTNPLPIRSDFLVRVFGPLLFLSLLAPEVLLIALPSFAQHLLSLRATEQSIEFHYTATITPFVLSAAVIGTTRLFRWLGTSSIRPLASELQKTTLISLMVTVIATNFVYGSFYRIGSRPQQFRRTPVAAEKERWIAQIPPDVSVVCTFDTMSHLAMRAHCYSMHYITGGQKTLSAQAAEPPRSVDYAIVDFTDRLTFGTFYHPSQPQPNGTILPSSEQLLRQFFQQHDWACQTWINSWTILKQVKPEKALSYSLVKLIPNLESPVSRSLEDGTEFVAHHSKITQTPGMATMNFGMEWKDKPNQPPTNPDRWSGLFYWLRLELSSPTGAEPISIRHGPCRLSQQADSRWQVIFTNVPAGKYDLNLILYDRKKLAEALLTDPNAVAAFHPEATIPVGQIDIKEE